MFTFRYLFVGNFYENVLIVSIYVHTCDLGMLCLMCYVGEICALREREREREKLWADIDDEIIINIVRRIFS